MTHEIRFYKVPDPYGYFGNFSRHPIELDGKRWPTTEHYFQAQKFVVTEPEYAEAIRKSSKASDAATMGRSRAHPLRKDWEEIKYHVMYLACIAKFTQHEDCKAMLVSSGDAKLIEDTRQGRDDDHVWGDGSTGTGQNLLGRCLEVIRACLQSDRIGQIDEAVKVNSEIVRVSTERCYPEHGA